MINFLLYLHVNKKCHLYYIKKHVSILSVLRKAIYQPFNDKDLEWIKMLLGAMFQDRPPPLKKRQHTTWDVNQLLDYFKKLGSNENLSLTLLSEKLATLVMLATMCRKCELSYLNLDNIIKYNKKVIVFRLDTLPKNINYQTPVGKANELVTFTVRRFKNNPLLCPLECMKHYVYRTARVHVSRKLFILNTSPFTAASTNTLGRWIKNCMAKAGIDTTIYSVHSITAASSTAVVAYGTPVDKIIQLAGWKTADVFIKTYFRPNMVDDSNEQPPAVLKNRHTVSEREMLQAAKNLKNKITTQTYNKDERTLPPQKHSSYKDYAYLEPHRWLNENQKGI